MVEQIPAVVFMAYLDRGIGEAYVSPQIEKTLGFSQSEWLEDPVRWYQQIHPDDKQRWSVEAAQMFLSGQPLRSAYRVISRDRRVIWFHCEAKMIRREDGRPWFIHGVAFDITELKRTEAALEQERNVASAILDTVGALVVVLDPEGRIVRFNRAWERTTGYELAEVKGRRLGELFLAPEEAQRFQAALDQLTAGAPVLNIRELLADAQRRATADQLVHHRSARPASRAAVYHRHRNRYHRTQTAGGRHPRSEQQRAAPHRPGSARRSGTASHRHRLHE